VFFTVIYFLVLFIYQTYIQKVGYPLFCFILICPKKSSRDSKSLQLGGND